MKIEFLYTEGCPMWKKSLDLLRSVLKERKIMDEVTVIKVETHDDAKKHHYSGSPQINIDDKDIDSLAVNIRNYNPDACRFYLYEGKTYEFPPKEMIENALDGSVSGDR